MTEHSKIDPRKAKRASLLERADDAFGLGSASPGFDPATLPGPKPKPAAATQPVSQPSPTPSAQPPGDAPAETADRSAPQPTPHALVEPAVGFGGALARIDRDRLRAGGLIVPEEPVSALLEELRIVKRDVIADARAGHAAIDQRILICSPHQGEGKTYCALNLAIALAAERDVEVVLVDADTMRPSIVERLGIEDGPGLMDALADPSCQPEKLVLRTDIEGLFVLPAGSTGAQDAEYLASVRTADVLDRLTRSAPNRFLIFDTPPALAASPAAELAAHVGQAILVARADETSRAALEDAQQLLSACANIKLLLNAARFSPSGRRFGEYGEWGS